MKPLDFMIISLYLNEPDFRLDGISHQVDENVHDSSKVSDDGCGGEEQAVGHDLQVQLDAHENHKHILPNLKQTY